MNSSNTFLFPRNLLKELIDHHMSLGSSISINLLAFDSTSTFNHMASADSYYPDVNDPIRWYFVNQLYDSLYGSPDSLYSLDLYPLYSCAEKRKVYPSELFYLNHTRKSPVASPKSPIKSSTEHRAPSPRSRKRDAVPSFLDSLPFLNALYTMPLFFICMYMYTYAWYKTYIMAILSIIMYPYAVACRKYIRAIESILRFAYSWYEWMHYLKTATPIGLLPQMEIASKEIVVSLRVGNRIIVPIQASLDDPVSKIHEVACSLMNAEIGGAPHSAIWLKKDRFCNMHLSRTLRDYGCSNSTVIHANGLICGGGSVTLEVIVYLHFHGSIPVR